MMRRHTEHTATFCTLTCRALDSLWQVRLVCALVCVSSYLSSEAGVLFHTFACWILTVRYMSEEVIRCDSLPKIHTAFCRTPLNCDALTLADSVVLGRWVSQRRRKRALIATEYTGARAEIMGKSLQLLIVTVLIHSSGTQIRCTISRKFFFFFIYCSSIKTFHSVKQRGQLAAWDVFAIYICWKCECKRTFNSPVHSRDMSCSLIPSRALDLHTHVFFCLEKHQSVWRVIADCHKKAHSVYASTILTYCKTFQSKSKKLC